jgi:hypothetical protein
MPVGTAADGLDGGDARRLVGNMAGAAPAASLMQDLKQQAKEKHEVVDILINRAIQEAGVGSPQERLVVQPLSGKHNPSTLSSCL